MSDYTYTTDKNLQRQRVPPSYCEQLFGDMQASIDNDIKKQQKSVITKSLFDINILFKLDWTKCFALHEDFIVKNHKKVNSIRYRIKYDNYSNESNYIVNWDKNDKEMIVNID